MSAPAEIARLFINATVTTLLSKIISLIFVAASILPPKVSISKIIEQSISLQGQTIENRSINLQS